MIGGVGIGKIILKLLPFWIFEQGSSRAANSNENSKKHISVAEKQEFQNDFPYSIPYHVYL